MKLTSKSSCFLRSMSQLVGRPSLVAILSNGKDSFWTSSWTTVSLAVCVRAVSDQRNINLQRPVCHHSKCFHESLFSFFLMQQNQQGWDDGKDKLQTKKKKVQPCSDKENRCWLNKWLKKKQQQKIWMESWKASDMLGSVSSHLSAGWEVWQLVQIHLPLDQHPSDQLS